MNARILILTILVSTLAFGGVGMAARPSGAGNGGGSGSGDGGGSEPQDFGDLFILNRNAGGIPILDENSCQQPIAFPSESCSDSCYAVIGDVNIVSVDPETCAVVASCSSCTQEVDFGRSNASRSSTSVLEAQLEDVVTTLAMADCISLDPAGRLVATTQGADGEVMSGTIDSPLQNLAIYKELVINGSLGVALPDFIDIEDTAARALGAASDKSGEVNIDMVVYLNQILGISDLTTSLFGNPVCQSNKEEVMGVVKMVRKCFQNYGGYGYERTANFKSLPYPAYILPTTGPPAGIFEYLALWSEEIGTTPDLFFVERGDIKTAVFGAANGFVNSNIGGFSQTADDTRAVIDFLHSHPIPVGYETAVPLLCDISSSAVFDVSISDISGLQVPERMVAGTEGREFTLTVANSGDFATGVVRLTAVGANGYPIPDFPKIFEFELGDGTSKSWTEGFSIVDKTTVTWTATAVPDCEGCDLNPANNRVTETTVTTGGGGGGRRN